MKQSAKLPFVVGQPGNVLAKQASTVTKGLALERLYGLHYTTYPLQSNDVFTIWALVRTMESPLFTVNLKRSSNNHWSNRLTKRRFHKYLRQLRRRFPIPTTNYA